MLKKWLPRLAHDPAFNRNLSLKYTDCRIETEILADWLPEFGDRPRVLGFPLDGFGSGHYRVHAPLWVLENQAKIQCAFTPYHDHVAEPRTPSIIELERMRPDVLLLQSTVKDTQIELLKQYKKYNDVFLVFDLDDLKTEIPDSNSRKQFIYKDMKHRLRKSIACCDRLVVSTEPIKQAYRSWADDIVVVPNRLEKSRWMALESKRNTGEKPRVGWVGAQQHHGDLSLIIETVKATADEIEWVFFGMCLEELKPFVKEVHDFGSPNQYPSRMAALHLDLAVAPLEQHAFNEAKSNLRLLEYGILGWPVVCTDIYPYQHAPVKRVANRTEDWLNAIRERIHDPDAAAEEGIRLRQWVLKNWMLEDHSDQWLAALTPSEVTVAGSIVDA